MGSSCCICNCPTTLVCRQCLLQTWHTNKIGTVFSHKCSFLCDECRGQRPACPLCLSKFQVHFLDVTVDDFTSWDRLVHSACRQSLIDQSDKLLVVGNGLALYVAFCNIPAGASVKMRCPDLHACGFNMAVVQHTLQGRGVFCKGCDTFYIATGEHAHPDLKEIAAFARHHFDLFPPRNQLQIGFPRRGRYLVVADSKIVAHTFAVETADCTSPVLWKTVCDMKNITRINLNVMYDVVVLCRGDKLGLEEMSYEARVALHLICDRAMYVRVVVSQHYGATKNGSVSDIAKYLCIPTSVKSLRVLAFEKFVRVLVTRYRRKKRMTVSQNKEQNRPLAHVEQR